MRTVYGNSKTLSEDLARVFKANVRDRNKAMDDGWLEFPVILGQGSLHDLSEADPRNPRLAGFKSVSYAGSVALTRQHPLQRPIGFHKPTWR